MTIDLQVDRYIVIMYVIDLVSDLQHKMYLNEARILFSNNCGWNSLISYE